MRITTQSLGHTDRDGWDCDAWTVTLHHNGHRMSLPFYMGVGHKGAPPTLDGVLETLYVGYVDPGDSFEDYCADFGGDSDSRKELALYREGRRLSARFRKFMGDDFDSERDRFFESAS
jgi:hypothetical protein